MAKASKELLSIVMPVYREAAHLAEVLAQVHSEVTKTGVDFELVLIDDGSSDNTWQVIEERSEVYPLLRAARFSRNFGKEAALRAGLEMAVGDVVIVMDADGQHPPSLIPEMIDIWRGGEVDIVEAVKSSRGQETLFSKLSAGLFYLMWNKMSGFELRNASDYKLLNRAAVDAYLDMPERNLFFRGMTAWLGFRRAQIPFEVATRAGGATSWSLFRLIRLAVTGITSFSSLPLQIVSFAGFFFLLFAFIFGVQTAWVYFSGRAVTGFATVIFLLLIIGSLLMISLGTIGEYVARIYDEVKGRPRYLIGQFIESRKVGRSKTRNIVNEKAGTEPNPSFQSSEVEHSDPGMSEPDRPVTLDISDVRAEATSSISLPAAAGRPFWARIVTLELMLFLGLWLFYGMLITAKNVDDFSPLQLALVEAVVDHHSFAVENNSAWPVHVDFFGYEGHTYINKQPGQAIIGSIVYAHLRLLGISFAGDKIFAGALVTFFSASLLTALAAVALYLIARELAGKNSIIWPLAAAFCWALGTTALAYSGIPHHDVVGTDMLVLAVYVLLKTKSARSPVTARNLSILSGFLLGFAVTSSMPAFVLAVVFGLYFLSLRRWSLFVPFILGGIAGVLPMFLYNTINFGSPLTFPAVMYFKYSGLPPDVYFSFDWTNFVNMFWAYYALFSWYEPILFLGLAGLLFLSSRVRREQLFIIAAVGGLMFYLMNVTGLGVCSYGPRLMLPVMPFCALGIVGLGRIPTKFLKVLMGAAVFWVGMFSFKVNTIGAVGGAIFCNMAANAYPGYVNSLSTGPLPQFPLFGLLFPLFLLWCVWAIYSQIISRSQDLPDGGTSYGSA